MSVSLRVTGTWAELVADGTVAIPATPQAGDRMYLFARWKDFSVTATVANWTELVEFADGSVSAGNGTGSVKVACWYRDWQSGDSDPTIDFSAAPDNASAVVIVMAKDASDSWLTPVAVTAAMTTWTTTSQSVSASSTTTVLGGGVVMGLIGIRDDTAVMTRPTNGIDDAGGVVTWNGNYVESPATHHSTTTGFDGAADLGYRLVTTGASGATLRMTGTISAAETGAALWVVQGVNTLLTPANVSLTISTFAPSLKLSLTPAPASLSTTGFSPQLRETITPAVATLSTTQFAPSLNFTITPPAATLILAASAPQLREVTTPASAALSVTAFAPSLQETLTPGVVFLSLTAFAPALVQNILITVPNASLTITTSRPHVLPFQLVFLDPGGDAVQDKGYFHAVVTDGAGISYDTSQQVAGVGSYKFDSGASLAPTVEILNVLGASGRVSFYWRYDSVPDATVTDTGFCEDNAIYSGGGFIDPANTNGDDGVYATATPARNAGQGSKMLVLGGPDVPAGAVIDSVKISYERKYDVDTSIGVSRVKWVVNGEEGPDHDNADMPLTDTVVEIDVTGDRSWEWQDLQPGVFEVIGEARRGDTDTPHTQSWDYVKVQIEYHLATAIVAPPKAGGGWGFQIAVTPKGAHSVVRFVDGAGVGYDGITHLAVNTQNRISFGYVLHAIDNLDINVFVNGIPELSIVGASTGGVDLSPGLHYGWVVTPGVDHKAWFTQFAIDDGDDLQDLNVLSTAKLPVTVNENNFNTTGGTGAVNERPLSTSNFKQHTAPTGVRQTYTIQDSATGDLDISGETQLGYMGWAWAKMGAGDDGETLALIVNNTVNFLQPSQVGTVGSLARLAATTSAYPSHAAGIGMRSNDESADTFLLECGIVIGYQGPPNPDILLPRQEVADETLDTIVDDLRADPPDSYEVCCNYDDFDGAVEIKIYALYAEGGEFQQQPSLNSKGRLRIDPGIEVRLEVTVSGVTNLQIWRRLNVD